jgi:diguanylate cyclase (GGDEF)-like protein/PAS domain S-box-containing protein
MGVSLAAERPSADRVVARILEGIATCVTAQTSFRRVLVSLYESPITPGSEASRSLVLAFACRGVHPDQESEVRRFVEGGGQVHGGLYVADARIGRLFAFSRNGTHPAASCCLPSARAFSPACSWQAQDVLLAPFWSGGSVIGQVSVDDPVDGAWPSSKTLALLEELADVGTVALRDARELQSVSEECKILQFLTESAMTGVLVIEKGAARYVNGRACGLLGYEEDELRSLNPWWQVIHPDDRPSVWMHDNHPPSVRGTIRAIRRDGRLIWLASRAYPMEPHASGAFVLHFYDVTDHVEAEALLKEKALRDPLTGLLNRGYFEDAILTEIERSRRYKRPLTLMMADLARFKLVNDRLGHQEGDRILSGVASVLRSQLRDSDWVVRFGGDEFLLVLPETGTGLEALEARLKAAVEAWRSSSDPGIGIGVDFGWATWTPEHDRGSTELVREADAMLYERKAER